MQFIVTEKKREPKYPRGIEFNLTEGLIPTVPTAQLQSQRSERFHALRAPLLREIVVVVVSYFRLI